MTKHEEALSLLRATGQNEILVALSFGKDSLAVLDLCVQVFAKVEAYYMRMYEDLNVFQRYKDYILRRYPVKLYELPHYQKIDHYKYSIYRLNALEYQDMNDGKPKDIQNHAKELSGIEWIAKGLRKTDSPKRRFILRKMGLLNEKSKEVYPVGNWTAQDVYDYLRLKKITLPPKPGGGKMNAWDIRPQTILWIHEHYPDEFWKVTDSYPLAEAIVKREEFKKRRQEQQSAAIHDEDCAS